MRFLKKYQELCWNSNEPLVNWENIRIGQSYSSDPVYGKLRVGIEDARRIVKKFAAEARFTEAIRMFDKRAQEVSAQSNSLTSKTN